MATFSPVWLPPAKNTDLDLASAQQDINKAQAGQLVNQGAQQDLTDRSTLRGLAPDLAARDPGAMANAAVLPGGSAAVNSLSELDKNRAALQNSQITFPGLGGADTSGAGSGGSGVNPAPGGGIGTFTPAQPGTFPAMLQAHESSDPTKINARGFAGSYQFGADRLADLGYYQPAAGESMGHNQNTWRGTFNIPGFSDVHTVQDFLNNVPAQQAALQGHIANIDQAIANTPGADRYDQNGLRAVAHLGGIGGMRKFVATNGQYNPGDAPGTPSGGTHLSQYYTTFSGLGSSPAQPGAPARPVQVASNTGTAGMPQTANDAAPDAPPPAPGSTVAATPQQVAAQLAGYRARQAGQQPAPPVPAPSATPAYDPASVVNLDSMDQAAGLPNGTPVRLPDGSVTIKGQAPAAASQAPGNSTLAAVQQATQEFGPRLASMDPAAANAAVQQRAAEIVRQGGGAAAPTVPPNALASPAAPSPAGMVPQPNALLTPAAAPSPGAPTPTTAPASNLRLAPEHGPGTVVQGPAQPGAALPGQNALYAAGGPPAGTRPVNALLTPQSGAAPGVPATGEQPGIPLGAGPAAPRFPAPPPATAPGAASQPAGVGSTPMGMPALPPGTVFARTGPGQAEYVTKGLPPGMAMAAVPNGQGGYSTQPMPIPNYSSGVDVKDAGTTRSFYDKRTGQLLRTEAIPDRNRMQTVAGPDGTQVWQSGQLVRTIPFSGRPEQDKAYAADLPQAQALTTAAQTAQANMPRLNEMADLATQLQTGPTAEVRAKAAQFLEAAGVAPDRIQAFTGMSSGSAAQEFVKLNITAAGAAAKADVGANNGIGATTLYMNANPGLGLLPDANKRITNMMRVASQATQDYAQAALQHFGDSENRFLSGGQYTPLTSFNRAWQAQSNPQVYAAATGILNGDSFEKWSAKLTPDEGRRAAQIAARVDPSAMVNGRGGGARPARMFLQQQGAQ